MGANSAVGKSFPAMLYAVGREKVREYAHAVGETDPLYLDLQAARAAGYADLVAPPMFCAVYAAPAVMPALFDPEVGIDFSRMVHGGQRFEWGPLVVAGDEISTTASFHSVNERERMSLYAFETLSVNQRGEQVCRGVWTHIVRGS